jgi:hypothetical protein
MSANPLFRPIIGTETEFGWRENDGSRMAERVHAKLKLSNVLPGLTHANKRWLCQGGVLYIDIGSHIEFGTPECLAPGADSDENPSDGPAEVAVQEWAGVFQIRRLCQAVVAETGDTSPVALIKNNTDSRCVNSFGNHMNVGVLRLFPEVKERASNFKKNLEDFVEHAAAMVVTMPLLVGAGVVHPLAAGKPPALRGKKYEFRISARSKFMQALIENKSTRERAIFLSRNEHHDGPEQQSRYWRQQILCFDSNILPKVIGLKSALLSLLAMMWVAGELEPISLADPVVSLADLSRDWRAPLQVRSGRSRPATGILRHYLPQMQRFVRRHHLGRLEPYVAAAMFQVRKFEQSKGLPPEELIYKNDWVTKWAYLQQQEAKAAAAGGLTYQEAEEVDFVYHTFPLGERFDNCLPMRLARKTAPGFLASVERAASSLPIEPTRAQVRGQAIALAAEASYRNLDAPKADWSSVRSGETVCRLSDPFSTDTTVLKLFEEALAHVPPKAA